MSDFIKIITWDRLNYCYTDITEICESIKHTGLKSEKNPRENEYKIQLELENTFYTRVDYECVFTRSFEKKIEDNADVSRSQIDIIVIESFNNKVLFSIFEGCIVKKIDTLPIRAEVSPAYYILGEEAIMSNMIKSEGLVVELFTKEKKTNLLRYDEFVERLKSINKLSESTDAIIEIALNALRSQEDVCLPQDVSKKDIQDIIFNIVELGYHGGGLDIIRQDFYYGSNERGITFCFNWRSPKEIDRCYEIELDQIPNKKDTLKEMKNLKKIILENTLEKDPDEENEIANILYHFIRDSDNKELQQFFLKQIPEEDGSIG